MSKDLFPIMDLSYQYQGEEIELIPALVGIPWSVMLPHEAQAEINHQQTLQRLAERGGLSACEAVAVIEDRPWHYMSHAEAHTRLAALAQQNRDEPEINGVVPCNKGNQCSWPACAMDCPGRPGQQNRDGDPK